MCPLPKRDKRVRDSLAFGHFLGNDDVTGENKSAVVRVRFVVAFPFCVLLPF